jgi:hypothetical protein
MIMMTHVRHTCYAVWFRPFIELLTNGGVTRTSITSALLLAVHTILNTLALLLALHIYTEYVGFDDV